jgi:hypothetical protein
VEDLERVADSSVLHDDILNDPLEFMNVLASTSNVVPIRVPLKVR